MVPDAGVGRKIKGAAGRAGLFSAILLAHGLLAALLLPQMAAPRPPRPPPERITYLLSPLMWSQRIWIPPPDRAARPRQSREAAAIAVPHAAPALRHRKASPTATATLRDERPDPCDRPLRPGEKPRPGCPDNALKTAPLALPGSLHLDERGLPAPDRQSIFAGLPPASPDQAAADAERHFAALQQRFPKWVPHTMELWQSSAMEFCGCSLVVVGPTIGIKPAAGEDEFSVSP